MGLIFRQEAPRAATLDPLEGGPSLCVLRPSEGLLRAARAAQ